MSQWQNRFTPDLHTKLRVIQCPSAVCVCLGAGRFVLFRNRHKLFDSLDLRNDRNHTAYGGPEVQRNERVHIPHLLAKLMGDRHPTHYTTTSISNMDGANVRLDAKHFS